MHGVHHDATFNSGTAAFSNPLHPAGFVAREMVCLVLRFEVHQDAGSLLDHCTAVLVSTVILRQRVLPKPCRDRQ